MLLSGFISILQITFLPGFIWIEIFKIKTDTPIQRWLYIFSFSLFINYGLVTVLTLLSIYTFYVLWGMVLLELLFLLFLFRDKLSRLFSKLSFRDFYLKCFELLGNNSTTDRVIFIVSGLVILFYCSAFFANIGTIFYFVDTVNNYEWNSWAIDFANNILPKYSSHFPQLLPANWSISYVMIEQTDVHFFPKAFMPLFFINNLLIFLDLALSKKDRVFLIGLIIYGLFGPIVYSLVFIADGNADLPVSFFAFLTFYSFIKEEEYQKLKPDNNVLNLRAYALTFVFAAMAAATKLAGFYIFTVAGLFLSISLLIKRKEITLTGIFKLAIFALFVIGISLFWYFRTPEVMYSGLHQPEYLPEGYSTIALRALKLMYYNWGLPVFAFFIITVTVSLFNKNVRYISIIMVIIPLTLWMLKYSADFRNLSFVVPFLSFTSAAGLFKIISLSPSPVPILSGKGNSLMELSNPVSKPLSLNNETLTGKNKLLLLLISALSGIMFLFFISDKFYLLLLGIYEFIHKYYFQSNRIVYFIEYGFLLHVDFYQRVLIALSIILFILPIFILAKIRLKTALIFILISITFLNFTIVTGKNILEHQIEAFNKVDARNYYEWLKMIIKKPLSLSDIDNNIHTNFKAILKDKIPGEINFHYMEDVSKTSLEKIKQRNYRVFLKLGILSSETVDFIKLKIESKEYKLLLNDRDFTYIFFIINPDTNE